MNLSPRRKVIVLVAVLILMTLTTNRVSPAPQPPPLPNPVLIFVGSEPYATGGKQWRRYKYEVMNRADYPNDMFAASPALPPCGANTKSSRTWVDLYTQQGKRLYGFCALTNHDGLGQLWFALEEDVIPPSWIYIEMNDRKTSTKYKSNLAESTL